jgi:hypothetical protein
MRLNQRASETRGLPRLGRKVGGRTRVGLVLGMTSDAQSRFFVQMGFDEGMVGKARLPLARSSGTIGWVGI